MRRAWSILVCLLAGHALGGAARTAEAAPPASPPLRSRAEIESVLAKAPALPNVEELRQLDIVLVADRKDHGPGEHDYPLWQEKWRTLLAGTASGDSSDPSPSPPGPSTVVQTHRGAGGTPKVRVATAQGWPSATQIAEADILVFYCYIPWNPEPLERLEQYLKRGGGLVLIHSATWTRPGPSADVARLTGCGGFTHFRHGNVELRIVSARHPMLLGLPERIGFVDETYWPPTPKSSDTSMQTLAVSGEPAGNGSQEAKPQPMLWTYPYGKGRVVGCVLGHYTWTLDDPYFRLIVLRGMAFSAGESPYRFDPLILRGSKTRD